MLVLGLQEITEKCMLLLHWMAELLYTYRSGNDNRKQCSGQHERIKRNKHTLTYASKLKRSQYGFPLIKPHC